MIVGISGKMQSGKDTVAEMWQFLSDESSIENRLDFESWKKYPFVAPQWEIKKFAGGVKKVASILTGISLTDLEKEDIKQMPLPKCWNILVSEDDEITLTKVMTVRELFQKIGTDAIRNNVHPDAWVNALMSEYVPTAAPGETVDITSNTQCQRYKGMPKLVYPNWLISDVRFPNEVRAIKCKKGVLIRVLRPGLPENSHLSETALDDYDKWDFVINNDGDIYKLLSNVNRIYNQLAETGRI